MYLDIYMQDLEISYRPFKYQAGTWNIREDLGNTNPLKYQSRVYSKVSVNVHLEILFSNLGNPLVIPLLPSCIPLGNTKDFFCDSKFSVALQIRGDNLSLIKNIKQRNSLNTLIHYIRFTMNGAICIRFFESSSSVHNFSLAKMGAAYFVGTFF